MNYNIKVFLGIGCKYNAQKIRKSENININTEENKCSIDLSEILFIIYKGFDGILIITKTTFQGKDYISNLASFRKVVSEANRILEKRGFSNQRIFLRTWNGNDYDELSKLFQETFEKIKKLGASPINYDEKKDIDYNIHDIRNELII